MKNLNRARKLEVASLSQTFHVERQDFHVTLLRFDFFDPFMNVLNAKCFIKRPPNVWSAILDQSTHMFRHQHYDCLARIVTQ